jgi:hypothetical protein
MSERSCANCVRVLLLEQEREILKRAAAFFAKESETR